MENYKLKNELKHYKEMYHNVEMLREEKYSLEARVRNMEQLSTENVRLDLENTRLKMEKLEWAGYLEKEDGLDIETPQGLVYNLTKERNESRWIVNQIDVFKKEMENRDQLILKLETHMNELKKTIQDKDRLHRSDVFAMELLEKDKIMLRKHIEALENQFKLYDIEESNYMEGNYDIQKTQRIQQLEELLKDFEGRLSDQGKDIIKSQMEASYSSPGTISPGPYFELASGQSLFEFMSNLSQKKLEYMEDTKTLQSNLNNANSQINILRNQLSLLQDYFGRHGMDPSSTVSKENNITQANNATDTSSDHVRILALKENPASVEYGIRKRQLENLRQENKILLEQLLHYQTSTIDSSMDLSDDRQDQETIMISIPKKTLQNMEDQKQALEQEVAKREKRIARKDEAYQRQLDQLADIMPGVLGYRLKPTYDGKMVLLESSYVNSKDLSFQVMFLKNGQSTVKVLGRNKQEYLRTLQSAYDTFITERKSIPGFLSAVTLDLQDRQAHIQPDMYDPTVTRDYDSHSYSEEDPLTDVHGHELVEPAAIDREDELDTDFVAQADDSGDNDYIECIPDDDEENNNDGYDEDRLKYFEGEDEEDTEDYEPKYENREIHNQERSQEATYEEYSNNDDDDDNGNDDDDDDLIDNEIKQHEHDQTEVMDEEDELGYGENDGDEDEEDEVGGNEDEDESMEESDEQQQQGQENDPISLDDDSD
ncbi:mitotic checkpoint protein-domain-containing protein [Halteromyces radiatus]|uniref:mitotic checkpoint protein-domain-containing protein n=1 Tax=Halteromyces radiatus TaxID=101107 RepID=UPI00221EDD55|nr:mitotic checkpoint protein-domain-containing protein [Halteromyces radiatus]KAI8076889.1 mitotic checkpoint protein-domain-containing protein [Halteromyces radiatus]